MPVVNNIRADHHVYIVTGVVDADVVGTQARKKLTDDRESTVIHHHDHQTACGELKHDYHGISKVNIVP
jgi:hypothetical protein